MDISKFIPPPPTDRKPHQVVRRVISIGERNRLIDLNRHQHNLTRATHAVHTSNDADVVYRQRQRNNRRVNQVDVLRQAEVRKLNEIMVDKITATALRPTNGYTGKVFYTASGHAQPHIQRSLNYGSRKRESDRIAAENQLFAEKLLNQQPAVANRRTCTAHSQRHEAYLKNILKYDRVPLSARTPIEPRGWPERPQSQPTGRSHSARWHTPSRTSRMSEIMLQPLIRTGETPDLFMMPPIGLSQQEDYDDQDDYAYDSGLHEGEQHALAEPDGREDIDGYVKAVNEVMSETRPFGPEKTRPFGPEKIHVRSPVGFYLANNRDVGDPSSDELVTLAHTVGDNNLPMWEFQLVRENVYRIVSSHDQRVLAWSKEGDIFLATSGSFEWIVTSLSNDGWCTIRLAQGHQGDELPGDEGNLWPGTENNVYLASDGAGKLFTLDTLVALPTWLQPLEQQVESSEDQLKEPTSFSHWFIVGGLT